jgi:Icc-related predicted phosphoesterase
MIETKDERSGAKPMLYDKLQSRLRTTLILLLTLSAALGSIQTFAHSSFRYDSFSFDLKVNLAATGGACLEIPPVGRIFFKTHQIPWQIKITLNEIDINRLEKQLNVIPPHREWLDLLQKKLQWTVVFLFTLVLLVGLGGSCAVLLFFRIYPNQRRFWQGIGLTGLMIGLLIGGTLLTYDQTAIERPQYQGVLAAAPWAMNLISMGLEHVEAIGNNLKTISQSLPMLYKQADQIESLGNLPSDLRILHVSDIHNNLAAFDLIGQLITAFNIQLVLDTGDLTDYGTALEGEIISKIEAFNLPYYFVPGNHESPFITKRLQQLKNVKVLSDATINFNGLLIAGVADPAAASYSSDVATDTVMEQAQKEFSQKITAASPAPDLVAVHNRFLAEKLIGTVPLILHGHDHSYCLTTQNNTIIVDAGTTGAAGLRGLTVKGVPYSASILYWRQDSEGALRLHAIDSIKINGVKGKFSLERHTYPEPSPAPTPQSTPLKNGSRNI